MKCRNFLSGPKPRKIKAMLPCRDPSLWFQPRRRGVSTFKVESRDVSWVGKEGWKGERGESLADRRGLAAGEDGNEERTVGIRVVWAIPKPLFLGWEATRVWGIRKQDRERVSWMKSAYNCTNATISRVLTAFLDSCDGGEWLDLDGTVNGWKKLWKDRQAQRRDKRSKDRRM